MAISKIADTHTAVSELFGHCLSTFRHSLRVGDELYRFAHHLGMEDTQDIYLLGILHDIGKLKVPHTILNKTSKLTSKEFKTIKMHTEFGERIMEGLGTFPPGYAEVVRYHHENWDGTGYYGLSGKDIPLLARMIRIIDSYDTMLNGRIYQRGKTQHDVLEELIELGGKHYDPDLVLDYKNLLKKSYGFQLVNGA